MSGDKNQKKLLKKPLTQRRQLIIFIILLSILFFGTLFHVFTKDQCADTIKQTKELIEKKKYSEATRVLDEHKQCGDLVKNGTISMKANAAQYNRYNALVLYEKGDKKAAKIAAEKALEGYKTIPDGQKASAVSDNFEFVDTMYDLIDDNEVSL